ncbi:1604_t:CDS:2 [Ambispora leptoticha]|uniref:1604_t:CDS:1 n=1 Tax=Ambispora leptoticha TaxID=144679 RepID=A0A9N8VD72_9GLOM|nr:1604_t:CDS:2 [Ambispora leptoticha]
MKKSNGIGGNNTPVSSTREVEHELGQILQSASSSPPHDEINTNTNNPNVKNPEQNISHAGSIKILSLQLAPSPYKATDEAQNNFSEMNQSQVIFNCKVVVTGIIFLSQNNSNISMYDVEDSQIFPNMKLINEKIR